VLLWYDTDSPASPANERPAYLVTPRTRLLDEVVASIPPEVPVSATGYAAIHLMNRPRPAMVPFGVDAAEYVLIDLFRPAFPVKLPAMLFFVRRLLDQPEWGVVRAERGVILLRRGAPRTGNARALAALDEPDIEAEDSEQSAYPNLAVRSGDASNGACLLVTPADRRGAGDLLFGPSYLLTPGGYEARFRLAAWRESYEPRERPAATIDVVREGRPLAARELRFRDFARPGAFEEFVLRFRVDVTVPVDFHVVYHDAGSLALDVIRIRKVEP
jgi:hypothetical protein